MWNGRSIFTGMKSVMYDPLEADVIVMSRISTTARSIDNPISDSPFLFSGMLQSKDVDMIEREREREEEYI